MRTAGLEDTIVAVSTPVGEGGIGIVRLSGPESLRIADKMFTAPGGGKPSLFRTYTTHYGRILEEGLRAEGGGRRAEGGGRRAKGGGRRVVDEVILTVMRAPKSYTKEDIVEINCHGGLQAVRKVLELAMRHGARAAEPGEFTKRAFLNGRIDLAQAEAVLDVIRAKTEGSLKVAMGQLDGELSRAVGAVRDRIVDIAAEVEASIDFVDEELETAGAGTLARRVRGVIAGLRSLIATYDEGAVLREGVLAIICGKPNVGKSSLMNLLLKRDRVIVSPIPGTTRDAVEEMINLRGVPIRLVDTAGIIQTGDLLEKEGVARSKKYLGMADIVILVLDHSSGLDAADRAIIGLVRDKKKVVVVNKCDLRRRIDLPAVKKLCKGERVVEVSVAKKKNMDLLEKAVAGLVWSGDVTQGESAVLSNARHKESLDKALANMLSVKKALEEKRPAEVVAVDLREAAYNTGLVIGKSVSGDILDRIFEKFCIGK